MGGKTLGVFAKRPRPGCVKTRLAESIGAPAAAELYGAFLADVLDRFRDAGDRRILGFANEGDDEDDRENDAAYFELLCRGDYELWAQPEEDLGGRMAAFFGSAFDGGASRVVLIGSDSPTLPREFVERAFDALAGRDCVLGPATDGGYVLVGLREPRPALFEGIAWSGPQVLRQTVQRCTDSGASLHLLPAWYDVDSAVDYEFLRGHLAGMQAAGESGIPVRTEAFCSRHTLGGATSL